MIKRERRLADAKIERMGSRQSNSRARAHVSEKERFRDARSGASIMLRHALAHRAPPCQNARSRGEYRSLATSRLMKHGLFLFLPFVVACSTSSALDSSPPGPGPSTEPSDASAPDSPTESCETSTATLELTFADGHPDAQLVAVKLAGNDAWLTIDTGSERTFLYGKDSLATRAITIGCETLKVISRNFEGRDYAGKPIVGVLGADFFVNVPTDFDYPAHHIVRHIKSALPTDVDGYTTVSYELDSAKHVLLRASVDTTPHLLMFDTGSPHVLLVPAQGLPTDQPTQVADVNGAVIDAFIGDSDIAIGPEKRRVPTYRIPKWPYFESYQHALHPDLDGLFGLTAMGYRRIVFDTANKKLLLGPIQDP